MLSCPGSHSKFQKEKKKKFSQIFIRKKIIKKKAKINDQFCVSGLDVELKTLEQKKATNFIQEKKKIETKKKKSAMTSIEMASQHVNTANNEEESIFLTSSDDDKDHESVDRDEYLAQEHAGYGEDASDNDDDFAYGNSYDDEDMERDDERRPIKVYDDYDPDNMDQNEDDSDDDIPLNLYSKKKRQLEQNKQESADKDSDEEQVDESSSDEDKAKKRSRPKRALEVKVGKKAKTGRLPPVKADLKKKPSARRSAHTDSDSGSSSSASSLETNSKPKQVKKNPPKENVNTDSTTRHLVKKASVSHKHKHGETSKLSRAQNIISGRVINFESGFKIPKRPSNESSNDKEPPEKKTKTEEKSTTEKTKVKDTKETVKAKASKPSTLPSSRPLTEKKVEKKPQPVKNGFKESVDFLEALSSSSSRKHSHSSKKAPLPSVPKIDTTAAAAASAAKNESSQDKKSESSLKTNLESTCNSTPCLINRVETVDNSDPTSLIDSHSSSSDSNLLKAYSNGLKSNLIISGTKKIAKKKVIWADSCSQQLESVQLFYLDESERVIKKEAYHGADMSKVDKLSEKEFTFRISLSHSFGDQSEEAVSPWPASLTPIDLPESTIIAEIRSEEREVQAKREANTLAVLVFKKFMPDSASEPDAEPASEAPKTRMIPLDEINSAETKLPSEEAPLEQEKFYTPGQETKAKPPLLSNPVPKTPLLPTPPVQPPSSSTEASGSKSEPASILNLLNLSNLSSSILRSNEDAERLKKILSLVGAPESKGDELATDSEQPLAKNNIPKTDTNNNPRWNNNWQAHKHSNQPFNRNQNSSQNQNQGRNVFANNFKRGMGNRASVPYTHGHNYRGNDSRANFSRQNYAMHGQNRSRFGENKSYEESERPETKSNQGGRWI